MAAAIKTVGFLRFLPVFQLPQRGKRCNRNEVWKWNTKGFWFLYRLLTGAAAWGMTLRVTFWGVTLTLERCSRVLIVAPFSEMQDSFVHLLSADGGRIRIALADIAKVALEPLDESHPAVPLRLWETLRKGVTLQMHSFLISSIYWNYFKTLSLLASSLSRTTGAEMGHLMRSFWFLYEVKGNFGKMLLS